MRCCLENDLCDYSIYHVFLSKSNCQLVVSTLAGFARVVISGELGIWYITQVPIPPLTAYGPAVLPQTPE